MDGGSTQRPTDGGRASSSWSKPGEMLERLQARPPAETRYDLREEIARGGMGAILRVWDGDLRRAIAMKVALGRESSKGSSGPTPGSSLDDRTLGRFLEEAQITAQLDHPGIVPVHELGLDSSGQVFFTMALVQGVHLGVVLRHLHGDKLPEGAELPDGEWTQTRMLGVLLKVCEAMAYAHAKGVLHRDLKPANVMIDARGRIRLMDFGISKTAGARTTLHTGVGTPFYMPPEQVRGGKATASSDLYSFGVLMYQLLTGELPSGRFEEPGEVVEELPGWANDLVMRCMERRPERRYQDMKSLLADWGAFLEAGSQRTIPQLPDAVEVYCPPGTFRMGASPGDDEVWNEEKPAREVTLTRGFWALSTPVTQAMYEAVTRENPSKIEGPKHPVEWVSWFDAVRFCNQLSEQAGLTPAYHFHGEEEVEWLRDADGFRLPTEAEWEYLCRAGSTSARYGELDKVAWFGDNSNGETHPVGQKEPNAWGLLDTLGNVWEWCVDEWDEEAYSKLPQVNPANLPARVGERVRRGA